MFIYSKRDGTIAASREDQIPEEIKHKRFDKLKELYESQVENQNRKYIGLVLKIMIEGPSKNNPEMFTGRTDSNKVVVFKPTGAEKIGEFVSLKILEDHKWFLLGEIC